MDIQTKFRVGEEIYTLDKQTLKSKRITISKIDVSVTEDSGIEVSYRGKGERFLEDSHNESVCFKTEEELISYIKE